MNQQFSRYQVFVITVLAILQFTTILDFMVLSPLSAILLPTLNITTAQFGVVVSVYAWSAGTAGLLAAGFADQYDRKKLLLIFYAGFLVGTLLCGIATDYAFLLVARVVTGVFGGIIGSVTFAIITDLFPMEVRGRVMGFVQMAFAGATVLGLPVGLYLANAWDWHAPFLLIVALGLPLGAAIIFGMKPVNEHLTANAERNALAHLAKTVATRDYQKAFVSTILLATGGFMLMPFGSAFAVNNLGITLNDLPMLYLITGICSMISSPLVGKLSDSWGKYKVFSLFSFLMIIVVVVYCNLGLTPLWMVIGFSIVMFIGVSARMVSSSALLSAVPNAKDRGAFMSINASVQMVSGGIASLVAGSIVYQTSTGVLVNYGILGYVVAGAIAITMVLLYFIDRMVKQRMPAASQSPAAAA